MKKILIPIDFSEYSEKAVEEGKLMAKAFDSEVLLLHVLTVRPVPFRYKSTIPNPYKNEPMIEKELEQAEESLNEYKKSFKELSDKVQISVLHGNVSDEILKVINEKDIDFVIMGSYGIGSALYRNFIGSVANKVVHHSLKPVLIVR